MTATLDTVDAPTVSTEPPTAPPRRRRARRRSGGAALTVNGLLIVGTAYMVLPLLWLVFAVTKDASGLYSGDAFSIGSDFFANMSRLLTQDDGIFLRWLANSILYAGAGAIIGGFVALMAGYAFDKFIFKGSRPLYALVLVGVLIPNTATVIPLYLLAASVGATNTIWAVLIPAFCNPFSVYLARVFSAGYLPNEVLEAARVDGAGPIRTFLQIGFPMLLPGFVTIALFQFVGVWNNFMLPLIMLQDRSLFPSSVGIALWQSQVQQNPDFSTLVIAGSFLSIVPLVIAFVMLQRFWRAGLSAGSVK
ncbi:sugar ABC transporter permease [Pseudoclavibacter sp. RFBJ3]|uniref:carbohydrate ABC transporter permease n=1 Tax=unclassified Pseudoclavibacter TaxID=2615177 RepID=UPI000CE7D079|nr:MULTISPECIES: carbohydrate ABC transporter permease [unclassified Pseudoclavibacter]PPF87216.1 sugar ABC transporter permease [Pseudoclavibacter sp. RFBJ5]PPF89439.1 sugar ABC transporter permease [Pseudoclavibacter sp. RFBJ3]PPG00756.1 sugar ABC transporter permease [Pseudoclavibacter sp. RFBH5]PPG18864.1 sugar ABC transporter permease [Pseudoclavibacter sp. RFBI4]